MATFLQPIIHFFRNGVGNLSKKNHVFIKYILWTKTPNQRYVPVHEYINVAPPRFLHNLSYYPWFTHAVRRVFIRLEVRLIFCSLADRFEKIFGIFGIFSEFFMGFMGFFWGCGNFYTPPLPHEKRKSTLQRGQLLW